MSKPGEDYMNNYYQHEDNSVIVNGVRGHFVQRPMGRGPTFVPDDQANTGDPAMGCNVPPGYIGDWPPYKGPGDPIFPGQEDNIPMWPYTPHYPPYYPYRPNDPTISPEELEKRIQEIKDAVKMKEETNPVPLSLLLPVTDFEKTRAIKVALPGHTKDTININVHENKIKIFMQGGLDFRGIDWPHFQEISFDIDEAGEEVVNAEILHGILTILVKNIRIPIKPKYVKVNGE